MAKIRILPEQLANQIAAGEVIERPASVVKELVENSLDAHATRVEIEIEGGGTRLIRVIDDGEGMDEDDLLLSLERHGTSKIKTAQDLSSIATLGFRGEAIPSIGSVSHLSIVSRPVHAELGTMVQLDYGKLVKVHETGCRYGTTCEVRNLFGNTPARRKFLRTVRTELGHIDEVVKNYALGSPSVTFIERVDGREILSLDGTLSLSERLSRIMHYNGAFIVVDLQEQGSSGRLVTGYLVPPEQVTTGPARIRLFVNGRAVRDRLMVHGVTEGLRGFLMKGKNPSGLIHLVLPPEEVDVNVHPAKHEVRFRHSRDIHALLGRAVALAMQNYQRTVKVALFGRERAADIARRPVESAHWESVPVEIEAGAEEPDFPVGSQDPETERPVQARAAEHPSTPARPAGPPSGASPSPSGPSPSPSCLPSLPRRPPSPQSLLATAEPLRKETPPVPASLPDRAGETEPPGHNLLVIGQFDDLYIFCKNSEGLLVIDQHAAHERLLYERLRRQYLSGKVASQVLMFPETVELSLFQSKLAERNGEEIARLGFSVRDFGGNTYIIAAIPALAGTAAPRELFLDVLEQFGSETETGRRGDSGGFLDHILASLACKAAVKSGTSLTGMEIDRLLAEMARADLFSHCPHGRPVLKQFSRDDVKKWFYRT